MKFDEEINHRLKSYNHGFEWYKPSPQDWADVLEEYPGFSEEFTRVFNNSGIKEADDFIP